MKVKRSVPVALVTLAAVIATATTGVVFAETQSSTRQATATALGEPDQTLADLKSGNQRFISGKVRTDGQSQSDIHRLASGQSPRATILSCSDSRLPPELVFDQRLGEVFTVRSAGESWANARGVAKDLMARSKIISSAVSTGKVKITVALYDLKTGSVTFAQ